MKKYIYLFLLLPFLILQSCDCSKKTCDCFDECENAITFKFDTDSLNSGFTKSEIDTILILKRNKPDNSIEDTVISVLDENSYFSFSSFCHQQPFTFSLNDRKTFSQFNYDFVLKSGEKFEIRELLVLDRKTGDDCCTCFRNERKTFTVNNVPYDFSGRNNIGRTVILEK